MNVKKLIRSSADFQYFMRNSILLSAVGIFFLEMYFTVDKSAKNNMLISSIVFFLFAVYYISKIRILFKNINGFKLGSAKLKENKDKRGRLSSFKANVKFKDGNKMSLVTKNIFAISFISLGAPKIKDYKDSLVYILYNNTSKEIITIKKKSLKEKNKVSKKSDSN